MESDSFDDDLVEQPVGPYGRAADDYHKRSWSPIPVISKWPPPSGWTGREGKWPSYPDIQSWKDIRGHDNVALRVPDGVVGIDVDAYGSKHGARTLADAEARWGELPPTWVSTSRADDAISGIRFYRVAKGRSWPGQLPGGDVELILWSHRYAVVWPSLHPDGREYFWRDPNGVASPGIEFGPADLPMLPLGWVSGLARGEFTDVPRADISARVWLWGTISGVGEPWCEKMAALFGELQGLVDHGSRHDSLLDAQMKIIRCGERGHRGTQIALDTLRWRFIDLVTGDGSRSVAVAEGEWDRAFDGAVSRIAATPTKRMSSGDPCDNAPPPPLAASLAIVQGQGETSASGEPAAPGGDAESGEERTSWAHIDLGPLLSGAVVETVPTALTRSDGQALLYPARINGLIGPSESGKSWVALEAARQVLLANGRVLLLDFEDSAAGLVGRLRALGLHDALIEQGLRYVNPDSALDTAASLDLARELSEFAPLLIILDGVNAAMSLLGYDLMSNKDATRFAQTLLAPLALTGAVVVYVDHVPKNDGDKQSSGGIGAQAKRAMTTGAAYRVDVVTPFGKGQTGTLEMLIDKDRPGCVRGKSPGAKNAGKVTIASDESTGLVSIMIEIDDSVDQETGDFRPTWIMGKIVEYLRLQVEPVSQNDIEHNVRGNNDAKRIALRLLVDDHEIVCEKGSNRRKLYSIDPGAPSAPRYASGAPRAYPSGAPSGPKAATPPGAGANPITSDSKINLRESWGVLLSESDEGE